MEKVLPSGAKLEITLAPFADGKALYKIVTRELKGIQVDKDMDLLEANFLKNIFCTLMSCDDLEAAIVACAKRCTYNGLRIDKDTFEPEIARGDYTSFLIEVAKENLVPFLNGLYAQYKAMSEQMKKGSA